MLSAFMSTFMGSSVNIALPSIGAEFKMDAVFLSWAATSYLLAAAVFMIPAGRAGDIIGRKKVFLAGIFTFTAASLLTIYAKDKYFLIAARVVQGIGAPMIFAATSAILVSVFPKEERGKVLGLSVSAVYAGLTAGPFLGGIFTTHFGWRAIFWFTILLGLPVTAAGITMLKGEWAEAKGEKFDFAGAFVFGASIISLIYGLSLLPEMKGGLLAAGGAAGVFVFVLIQDRVEHPLINIDIFLNLYK